MMLIKILRKQYRYIRKAYELWGVLGNSLGWARSFKDGRAVDADGEATPWYTYPAIEFLRTLDMSRCRVFEYGCGNSSVFFAKRAKEIFAAENDPAWAAEIQKLNIANLKVLTAEEEKSYIEAPYSIGGQFDIMIIDGRYRKDCAIVAAEIVQEDGLIIFDNADWYPNACESLRSRGWFQMDFSGMGPLNSYVWTTAFFVRTSLKMARNVGVKPTGSNLLGESKG